MAGKLKVVGFFKGNECKLSIDGSSIAWFTDLKYTGRMTTEDNMGMYKNKAATVFMDYAVYE